MNIINIWNKKEISSHFDAIQSYINEIEAENLDLRKKLDEYNKEDEVQKKQDELNEVYDRSLVVMTDLEYERQQSFMKKHSESCKNPYNFLYELVGTGIGTVIKIKCPMCEAEEDITDYAAW